MSNVLDAQTFESRLQRLREADAAMMPFGRTIGFRVERIVSGEAVVVVSCNRKLHNVFGYTHGGAIFSLADTAIGLAHVSLLESHQTSTTVESKINFLRPALSGELRAHARCVKQGRTLSFFECDVLDGENRLIARSNATMMTLTDDSSQGRDLLYSPELEESLFADEKRS
jgi:uncharacterized protein (TIGR00369 family)